MPKRFRLTRRFPAAMTEDGYRQLKRFTNDTGLKREEALSFLFENFDHLIDSDAMASRLRTFTKNLADRKL